MTRYRHYFRHPKTQNERRQHEDDRFTRPMRRPHNLPNDWDDIVVHRNKFLVKPKGKRKADLRRSFNKIEGRHHGEE